MNSQPTGLAAQHQDEQERMPILVDIEQPMCSDALGLVVAPVCA